MLDIFSQMEQWVDARKNFALATVVETWHSAPRMAGSAMAISDTMEVIGSVSGGCIEGAVIKEALEVIKSGTPKLMKFGIENEDAWTVGLSCGGKITVFVEPFMAMQASQKEVWEALRQCIGNNKSAVLLSQISGQQNQHALVYPNGEVKGEMPQETLLKAAQKTAKNHQNQIVTHQDEQWFVQDFPEKTRMVIVGSAHISLDLIHLANQFNFETIVIDPRKIFTAETRFLSQPAQLYHAWPAQVLSKLALNQDTYAVLLSHDPKIDDQALHALLRSEVAYIGCLGSRKTHAKRLKRLEEAGFTSDETDRIFAPVGVDIHAKTPQEIALSVMAQVVEIKNNKAVVV